MSTERDTQFTGFAKAHYNELKEAELTADSIYPHMDRYKDQAILLIAQYAYDLVEHISNHSNEFAGNEPDMPTLPITNPTPEERKRILREITHLAEDSGMYD